MAINKSNEATPLRPKGNRVLEGPLVDMNLEKFMDQVKSEITWTESDRNAVTLFKSDTMRIVLLGLHENAALNPHQTNGVISLQVLEGKINFITDEKQLILEKGDMLALQANIIHSVIAMKESFFLLTISMNPVP